MNATCYSDRNGAAILDDVHAFLGRFVAYPSAAAHVAHTLWIAHAHLMDCWESTPRLAFLSPERGSGKTRALEITELLVPNPVEVVNVSPAYLFRKVGGEVASTILFDEIDTVFGPKAKANEEIRGLLNAGHRRGAVAGRCVVRGKLVETEEIPAYCAVALAGIGDLPDTILSRSIIIRMRRRAPDETVEPYRRRVHAPEGQELRDRLAGWSLQDNVISAVRDAWPNLPNGVADRDADVWEALLAVADAVGNKWPSLAGVSCVSFVSLSKEGTRSLGTRLLGDLRKVFSDADAMATVTILERLNAIEEAPWGDLRGKPLDAHGLSKHLSAYCIKPKQVRIDKWSGKGYAREDMHDAWLRYLPPPVAPSGGETGETSETPRITSQCNETKKSDDLVVSATIPVVGVLGTASGLILRLGRVWSRKLELPGADAGVVVRPRPSS